MKTLPLALATLVALNTNIATSNAFSSPSQTVGVKHGQTLFGTSVNYRPSSLRMSETKEGVDLTPIIPFTPGVSFQFKNLTNDGPFAWIIPYLLRIGYTEGNTVVGAIPVKATGISNLSDEEVLAIRQKAEEELTNIGPDERERRARLGNVLYSASAIVAAYSAIFLDDGTLSGHLIKFAVLPFLLSGRGLQLSAQLGL